LLSQDAISSVSFISPYVATLEQWLQHDLVASSSSVVSQLRNYALLRDLSGMKLNDKKKAVVNGKKAQGRLDQNEKLSIAEGWRRMLALKNVCFSEEPPSFPELTSQLQKNSSNVLSDLLHIKPWHRLYDEQLECTGFKQPWKCKPMLSDGKRGFVCEQNIKQGKGSSTICKALLIDDVDIHQDLVVSNSDKIKEKRKGKSMGMLSSKDKKKESFMEQYKRKREDTSERNPHVPISKIQIAHYNRIPMKLTALPLIKQVHCQDTACAKGTYSVKKTNACSRSPECGMQDKRKEVQLLIKHF